MLAPGAGLADPPALADPPDARSIRLFGEVLALVRSQYVGEVDETALTDAALRAMLASLDGHSAYMTAADYAGLDEKLRGEFSGVGMVLALENGLVRVVSPIDGGPAARAGVVPGAQIIAIDGKPVTGLSLAAVVARLRGSAGSHVAITLAAEGKPAQVLDLAREVIKVASVYSRAIGSIGYVRMTEFGRSTPADFAAALHDLRKTRPVPTGLVLDLRNNPGGVFESAIAVASSLLAPGQVVVRKGRNLREAESFSVAPPGDLISGVPVVVLVNGGSASSSEVLAGALQDQHRAVLVGLTTWGKGLVQTVIPLGEGRDGAVSITAARYYTPSGRSIQKVGIVPDLQVARSEGEVRALLDGAGPLSEATLVHALDNEASVTRRPPERVELPPPALLPAGALPPLFAHPVPSDADLASDFQLQRALDVLTLGGIERARAARPWPVFVAPPPPTPTRAG